MFPNGKIALRKEEGSISSLLDLGLGEPGKNCASNWKGRHASYEVDLVRVTVTYKNKTRL